jgi:hypothetical protein
MYPNRMAHSHGAHVYLAAPFRASVNARLADYNHNLRIPQYAAAGNALYAPRILGFGYVLQP